MIKQVFEIEDSASNGVFSVYREGEGLVIKNDFDKGSAGTMTTLYFPHIKELYDFISESFPEVRPGKRLEVMGYKGGLELLKKKLEILKRMVEENSDGHDNQGIE